MNNKKLEALEKVERDLGVYVDEIGKLDLNDPATAKKLEQLEKLRDGEKKKIDIIQGRAAFIPASS